MKPNASHTAEQPNRKRMTQLEKYLTENELVLENVIGDGNCFFNALAPHAQCSAGQLRREIVRKMAENPKIYEGLYERSLCEKFSIICESVSATNIHDRIEHMLKDQTWAGFIERFAAAFYFGKNIVELEQLKNSWVWKIFVCETNPDAYENWHTKENIHIHFEYPHFQRLINKGKTEAYKKYNYQVFFLYQMLENEPGVFACAKRDDFPTDFEQSFEITNSTATIGFRNYLLYKSPSQRDS